MTTPGHNLTPTLHHCDASTHSPEATPASTATDPRLSIQFVLNPSAAPDAGASSSILLQAGCGIGHGGDAKGLQLARKPPGLRAPAPPVSKGRPAARAGRASLPSGAGRLSKWQFVSHAFSVCDGRAVRLSRHHEIIFKLSAN